MHLDFNCFDVGRFYFEVHYEEEEVLRVVARSIRVDQRHHWRLVLGVYDFLEGGSLLLQLLKDLLFHI